MSLFAAELLADTISRHAARELLIQQIELAAPPPEPPELRSPDQRVDDTVLAGVLARAMAEWTRGVREPPGKGWERIDTYIRGPEGLGWPSAALNDTDARDYRRNRQFAWCGAFAAFCWSNLKASIRKRNMASTYRIGGWSQKTARRLFHDEITPGCIVVVGPEGEPAHITISASTPYELDGVMVINTIEGNASGRGPDGSTFEGVIRKMRPLASTNAKTYRVHYGVRPLNADLAET